MLVQPQRDVVAELFRPVQTRQRERTKRIDQGDGLADLLFRLFGRHGLIENGLRDELILAIPHQPGKTRRIDAISHRFGAG